MTVDPAAAAIADEALNRFVAALATHDPDRVLETFTDAGAIFGSDQGEEGVGGDGMRAFFTTVCDWPYSVSWSWEFAVAAREGDVVWFAAPGACLFTHPDGTTVTAADPYRLSGVLRNIDGSWKFALFNGCTPDAPE